MMTDLLECFNIPKALSVAMYETLKYEKFHKKPDETLHYDDEQELWCELVRAFLKK